MGGGLVPVPGAGWRGKRCSTTQAHFPHPTPDRHEAPAPPRLSPLSLFVYIHHQYQGTIGLFLFLDMGMFVCWGSGCCLLRLLFTGFLDGVFDEVVDSAAANIDREANQDGCQDRLDKICAF